MTRLMGALAVCAACGWMGWSRLRWYQARCAALSALAHAMDRMASELNACQTDTAALLALLAEGEDCCVSLFARCLAGLDRLDELPFDRLWAEAVRAAQLPLRGEETGLLLRAGEILGRYEGREQARLLHHLRRALETRRDLAQEEARRYGRLSLLLGLSAGLMLSLLLMPS